MSPELEQLLEAYYEKRTCPPEQKAERVAAFDVLLIQVLARKPGLTRDALLTALAERYSEFRRQRLKSERARLSRLR
jgi:hypothetical protein